MGPGTVFLSTFWTLALSQTQVSNCWTEKRCLAPLRREVAAIALTQAKQPDPAWHPNQRDCAGLVRFAYRAAHAKLKQPSAALWRDSKGARVAFADAETLLAESFASLGRNDSAEIEAESGDLLAFRTDDEDFHLMLYVRAEDRARTQALVVYSPGDGSNDVRVGSLRDLKTSAPIEWRPVASNPRFLGFYRFKDWMNHDD